MKLFFKAFLFFIIALTAYARDIVVISYKTENHTVKTMKKILINNPELPELLTKFKQSNNPCKANKSTILHLCVEGDDFKVIHQNKEILIDTFSAFRGD